MRLTSSAPPDPTAFMPGSTLYAEISREGRRDSVAVEDPLEIRVDGEPISVTMRTPGHDEELALGFLFGEGLIGEPRAAGPDAQLSANVIDVEGPLLHDPGRRRFYTTSSCGVCGKARIDAVRTRSAYGVAADEQDARQASIRPGSV